MAVRAFVLRFQERSIPALGEAGSSGHPKAKILPRILAGTQTLTEIRAEGPDTDPGERNFFTFKEGGVVSPSPTWAMPAGEESPEDHASVQCGTQTGTRVNAESPDADPAASSYGVFSPSTSSTLARSLA